MPQTEREREKGDKKSEEENGANKKKSIRRTWHAVQGIHANCRLGGTRAL